MGVGEILRRLTETKARAGAGGAWYGMGAIASAKAGRRPLPCTDGAAIRPNFPLTLSSREA